MVRSGRRQSSSPDSVGRQIQALADVLAGEVEERLGRLQDAGVGLDVAALCKRQQQRIRPGGGSGSTFDGGGRGHFRVQISGKTGFQGSLGSQGSRAALAQALAWPERRFDRDWPTDLMGGGLTDARPQPSEPARPRQSPSTACTSASAATPAVSARRIRGPAPAAAIFGCRSSSARSSSANPPSGPISDVDAVCRRQSAVCSASIGIGDVRRLVAEHQQPLGGALARETGRAQPARRPSARLRMPHCSAASMTLARIRSVLTRETWVNRVNTGCSVTAPISTAFCTM